MLNDQAIQTYDKYGKVTVIVEEGDTFSDQLVMLNVLISDIFSISTVDSYSALNLPLGSAIKLPIHFLNEHAHRFAKNVEGIKLGLILSHPRVVSAQLDQFNQTLTLTSQGSGECNVVVYLVDHPHIFDVIRVKVSSIVKPLSPVHLHLGGGVSFKVYDSSDAQQFESSPQSQRWSSSNPSVLQINPTNGQATGLSEGSADVLLSNHANAASIVHVSKVGYGQVE